jgi:hypothetical protein
MASRSGQNSATSSADCTNTQQGGMFLLYICRTTIVIPYIPSSDILALLHQNMIQDDSSISKPGIIKCDGSSCRKTMAGLSWDSRKSATSHHFYHAFSPASVCKSNCHGSGAARSERPHRLTASHLCLASPKYPRV